MKFIIVLLLHLLIMGGCSTQSDPVDALIYDAELIELLNSVRDEYNVPGIQVCILDPEDTKTYRISLGFSDMNNETPMNNTTQVKAGSITKSFTGISILNLVQKGLINLDDSLGKYLDLSDHAHDGITLKKLLNMHSGLLGYLNDDADATIMDAMIANPDKQCSPEELVSFGFQLTENLGNTEENEFHYTNTNYILLGMLIEKVSGLSYADFICQEITDPLGLSDTYIPTENENSGNISGGYYINLEENSIDDFSNINMSYVWSAGAVISTASDLCKWMNLIGNNEVISGPVQNYVYEGLEISEGAYYTSGLINEPTKIWHNGTVLGYHGEMCYLKDSGISVAVLTNCNVVGTDGDPVKDIMDGIIDLLDND